MTPARLMLAAGAAVVLALATQQPARAQYDNGTDDTYPTAQPDDQQERPLADPNPGPPASRAATAAAIPTAATGPTMGSVVDRLPAACVSTPSGGVYYFRCGAVWYQPHYEGTTVSYVVVRAP